MMGIEEATAKKALIACKNSSVDAAMSLIFEEGLPDDEPETQKQDSLRPEAVETLMSAGFTESKAKAALAATGGDLERLLIDISHPEESEPEPINQDQINFSSVQTELFHHS